LNGSSALLAGGAGAAGGAGSGPGVAHPSGITPMLQKPTRVRSACVPMWIALQANVGSKEVHYMLWCGVGTASLPFLFCPEAQRPRMRWTHAPCRLRSQHHPVHSRRSHLHPQPQPQAPVLLTSWQR